MANEERQHHSIHEGTVLRDKFTTEDIFERILQVAHEEVTTGPRQLFFSALAAGFAITLTFFLYASMTGSYGDYPLLGKILYPLGFVFIVLGGYQLFTENTLPPVALVFERMASLPRLLYVWSIVLAGNVFGGLIGAFALANTGIFTDTARSAAIDLAITTVTIPSADLFFRGMMAGLIVAGVVWLDYAMRDGVVRFFIVYISFFAITATNLNHVVITATEAFFLMFSQGANIIPMITNAIIPVLVGNALGGVLLVTVVNYFQTPGFVSSGKGKRLSWKDWLFSKKVCNQ